MVTLYEYIYNLWITYVNPALPIADYIDKVINYVCIVILLLLIFFPLLIALMIIFSILSRRGRRYND